MLNQRGFMAVLTLVLLIVGVIMGGGRFPIVDGTEFTPEFVLDLILQIVAPLVLFYRLVRAFLDVITARVALSAYDEYSRQAIDPGRWQTLFRLPEFYMAAIGSLVFIVETFTGVRLFDESTQALLANAIMAVITALLDSWAIRPSGAPILHIAALAEVREDTR